MVNLYELHEQLMWTGKPLRLYGNHDVGTLQQFLNVCQQENVVQAALMPDGHLGYTMPIGGVALVKDAVYPSWVGYDIGCGVCAIKVATPSFNEGYVRDEAPDIWCDIVEAVPRDKHKHAVRPIPTNVKLSPTAQKLLEERGAARQLGTLGSGNHFLEVSVDEETRDVWIVIHSGSRGIGHGIAGHWMSMAALGRKTNGMDYFDRGTPEYEMYMADQQWCIRYALENRCTMLRLLEKKLGIAFDWDTLINKVHNMATEEAGGVLHRKGATSANLGELGVIPGNMRDGSAIVKGTGNEESLVSCSHGAGRAYGRGAAKRELSLETFEKDMENVYCRVDEASLDESPAAYKNFFNVLEEQQELCTVEAMLKPIVNVKG